MKKLKAFLLAGAFMVTAFTAGAQTDSLRLVQKGGEEFAPHLFIQPQIGCAHTVGENSFGKLLSPTAAVNVGYLFNDRWSVRGGLSGWQAKGAARYDWERHSYKFNFVQLSVDGVLDVTNLFREWTPEQRWSGYAFLGVGCNLRFNNKEAQRIADYGYPFPYLWSGHRFGFVGRGGIGGSYKLNERIDINAEVNSNGIIDHFNSKHGRHSNIDWQFNALVGVTFHIGERAKITPDIYAE